MGIELIDEVAILRHELADANRRAENLHQVIESFSGELTLEPLLTRLVASATELIDARYGSIGLVVETPSGLAIRTAAIYNMPPAELGAVIPLGAGLAGRVLATRQVVVLRRYGDLERPTLPELAEHTVIGMPIWWAGRMIGFFGIGADPPRGFDESDSEMLSLVARHAAIAIQNARLFETERRRAARIAIINRIGRLITSSLSISVIFQTAAESIHEQLGFAHVGVGIIDPDDPEMLVSLASAGIYASRIPPNYRQSIHVGLVGYAARTGERVLVNNVAADPHYLPLLAPGSIQAELVVPIAVGERLLGVLNIESIEPISEDDAEGVAIIADQLGIAMDNAQRYEQEKRRTARLELIARVGQRIAARLDPDELFPITVEEVRLRLGYDHVALFLLDPNDPGYLVQRARASRWPPREGPGYRQSIAEGVLGAAARQRTSQLVNDVASDARYIPVPGADEIRAELAMPIMLGERLLGVLDFAGTRRFSSDDVAGMQVIADQLAIAIDHAGLFARTQQALDETRLLYETSRRISTAMDLAGVVEAYLEQVAARGRYHCTVLVYDLDATGHRTEAIVRGFWSAQSGMTLKTERYPYDRDPLDALLDLGQTITMTDALTDPRASESLRELQRQDGRPALAFIPLMVGGWRIGLVVLSYPQVHDWPDADLKLYQVTAAQLAAAIDSRRQHLLVSDRSRQVAVLEERRRLARELHDSVTQSLFSMSLLAQVLPDLWEIDREEAQGALHQIRDLTRSALAEMRALLFELRPAALGEQDLSYALRDHTAAFQQRTGIEVSFSATGQGSLPSPVQQTLFRIAQEALANVARHTHARHVKVVLHTGRPARLQIGDDGQGFQPEQIGGGHFGMISMRERAGEIGARLEITSAPGQGTEISVVWPGRGS
jgi:signal transduction histidine kinase